MSFFAKGASALNNQLIKIGKKTGANKKGSQAFDKYSTIGQRGYKSLQSGDVVGVGQSVYDTLNEGKKDADMYSNILDQNLQKGENLLGDLKYTGLVNDNEDYYKLMDQLSSARQENAAFKDDFVNVADQGLNKISKKQKQLEKLQKFNPLLGGGGSGTYKYIEPQPKKDIINTPVQNPYITKPSPQLMPDMYKPQSLREQIVNNKGIKTTRR